MTKRVDTVDRVVAQAVLIERARMTSIAADSGAVLAAMARRMGYTRSRVWQLKEEGDRLRGGQE